MPASPSPHPLALFQPVNLTRQPSRTAAGTALYSALDLETTGLNPRSDRICEVAVVRFYADGSIVDEYATLIDPQWPIRASEYHGITDDDIAGAPTFREAWPDISRMLTGSVVVAHNLRFDDHFLAAELARAGEPAPHLVAMCSAVACRSQLEGPSYALQSLYRTATSRWFEDSHTALGDSRALATLVPWLLTNAPAPLWLAGPVPSAPRATAHPPGRIAPRAARLSRRQDGYLGAIARRFPLGVNHPVEPEAARQYIAALDAIITDQRITGDEGWHMELLARRAGFTQQRLVSEHRKAWERATANLDLERPERLSTSVRNRLVQLAHDLGHPTLATPLVLETAPSVPRTRYLRGWRVGVDGTGPAIEELTQLVVDNGGAIAQRITATVQLVIADAPGRTNQQLERAREFDIPVLDPNEAREHLRPVLDAASAAERQQQEERYRWQAERDKYEAEQDAFFRHRWREVESSPEWDDERGDDELEESHDEEDWEETSTSLPTRSWQDEVAEIELPRGGDLLTAWERARNAQVGGLSPAGAAELGAALRAEFEKYTEPGGLPPLGVYQELRQLEEIAGRVRGRFYVEWLPVLDDYRAARQDDEALDLLLDVIAAAERFAHVAGGPPAPAYTERAAVIYRRRHDYDAEVQIIERWQNRAPKGRCQGSGQAALSQRLEAARRLRHRARQAGN